MELQNNVVIFEFDEYLNDGNYIYLKDKQRMVSIAIPINGGPSRMSVDGGQHWVTWNQMFVKSF